MNILLLGGTGNISTDCAALLHDRGHHVLVLTRGRTPVPAEYTALVADCKDVNSLRRAVADVGIDVVIDFIGYDVPDLETTYEVFRDRVQQYIFISTTVVYRKPPEVLPVTEKSPLGNAFSAYGRKKQACEEFLMACHGAGDLPVTIVRPSHTYSCRWVPNPVTSVGYTSAARLEAGKPIFIHGDGQGLWTLTASTDFAVGLAGLVGNTSALGEAFQITSDQVLTWSQVLVETCLALGIKHPDIVLIPTDFICEAAPIMCDKLKGDKAHHGVFDNSKIKHFVPDFECSKSFRQGIREAIAWFKADPARQTVNQEADAIFETVIRQWRQV